MAQEEIHSQTMKRGINGKPFFKLNNKKKKEK